MKDVEVIQQIADSLELVYKNQKAQKEFNELVITTLKTIQGELDILRARLGVVDGHTA